MHRHRGLLIAVEGVTGAGKTTLAERLRGDPRLVFAGGYGARRRVPNPFHRDLLRAIRGQLRRDEFLRLDWRVECLVLQAELLLAEDTLIRPSLAQGRVVIYEHYADSIYAYQAARLVESRLCPSLRAGLKRVMRVLAGAPIGLVPHHTIHLATASIVAARRAALRDGRRLNPPARKFSSLVAKAYDLWYAHNRSVTRVNNVDEAFKVVTGLAAS